MTKVYLIRHSQPMSNHIGTNNSIDSDQVRNEKNILTPDGEQFAKELASKEELQHIDVLYTSNYVRAMSTAKYIVFNNDIEINIDGRLGERKFGWDFGHRPDNFETRQWEDFNYKVGDGESINDTKERITSVIDEIINKNKDKNICIVSHATAISAYFLNFLELRINDGLTWYLNNELVFDGKWDAPHAFELEIEDGKLISFKNIGK